MDDQLEHDTTEAPFENEVTVLPGRCIAWTGRTGHCLNPADDLACVQHAKDFEHVREDRPTYFRAEDYPEYASMARTQRERFRKAIYMKAKRAEARGLTALPTGHDRAIDALNRGTEVIMMRAARKNAKRREFIMARLEECGFVSTADVAAEFDISSDTVKSVLCDMAEEGIVERVYGGAKLPGVEVKGGTLRRPRQNP